MKRARIAAALALGLTITGTFVAPTPYALADADPASDVLLAQNAFFPYQPPAPTNLSNLLEKLLGVAAHEGLPLKVAIIGAPEDLGAVPDFFGHPQQYANFLDREISFNHQQPLLVVMPAGFATIAAGPPAALAGLKVDAKHSTYGLIVSAIRGVVASVRADGHPLAMPSIPAQASAGGGGSLPGALVFALPALLLILAGVATLRSGGSSKGEEQPPGAAPA
jgi:hypothetical protein